MNNITTTAGKSRGLEASLLLAGEDLLVGERLELVAITHVELVLELDPVGTKKVMMKTLVVEGGGERRR
jgi:hypothetical protein